MKSMKFIIMLLIFAILLSTLVVAISAATETLEVVPTVTLDGIMDEKEGWDKATVFDFAMHVQDGTGSTFVKREDRAEGITGSSSIRFRNDNDYLYIYYETSNSDTLTQTSGNGGLVLRIVPQNNVNMQSSVYADGTYMHLWLNVANNLEFLNEDIVGSIHDFTFTDPDNTVWGLGMKTPVNQFGFKGWYDSYGDYSSAFAKNTTIALHIEKDADNTPIKKAYEIKMPLSSTYKNRLGSSEPTFYFSAYERSRQYNGTDVYAVNGGYLISTDGTTPVSFGHDDVGVKDNSTVTNGIPVTLTKIIDPNAPAETTAPETTTKAPETTKAPATTTKAPATTTKAPEQTTAAATTAVTEEKSGCGSSIALTSIALVTTVSASVVFVSKKRKDD